jgi:hypothetical protein
VKALFCADNDISIIYQSETEMWIVQKSFIPYHEILLCMSQSVALTLSCQVTQTGMIAFRYTVDRKK